MTLHRPRPCGAHACIFLSRHNVSNPLYLLRPMSNGRAAVFAMRMVQGNNNAKTMLDSRSTSEHSKPCYPYATVSYFFTKISPPRNLLFHCSDNECRFYLWCSIYTRQRGKLCTLHDHTLAASLSCSFSFYSPRNNVPVLLTTV